jgi:hypothetical protein
VFSSSTMSIRVAILRSTYMNFTLWAMQMNQVQP